MAIVGPNAKAIVLSGGGSAALKASYFVSPYEGIVQSLKEAAGEDIQITYSEGARGMSTIYHSNYVLIHCSFHDDAFAGL